MKEQYVGDVSDYRKYALLRALSQSGRVSIGVCWMLTPPDEGTDGDKRRYLNEPDRWRGYDPPLFDLLQSVDDPGGMERLSIIERSGILRGARFFNQMTPDDSPSRQGFMRTALLELGGAELIFFDPDNGLDVKSVSLGRKKSSKYLYRSEVQAAFQAGHSLLIYQHFPRHPRESFIDRRGQELRDLVKPQSVWAFRTPHVVLFLLVHFNHAPRLEEAAGETADRWDTPFLSGKKLECSSLK